MLFSITCHQAPARDLGLLLHKHPDLAQSFPLSFGQAHVLYPQASDDRCTATMLVDVDPVGLVRHRRGPASLDQYVNDRPYAAASFLSVAIAEVYGTALSGRCALRPELPDRDLDLDATIDVLPCRGGESLLRQLFEPLGYEVTATRHPLDARFPTWGESPYFRVRVTARKRLVDLLSHVYVLAPVLDDEKHYWVEGAVHIQGDTGRHAWHLGALARLSDRDPGLFVATDHRIVDVTDPASEAAATEWWVALVEGGGEGMVVKPASFLARGRRGLVQPAIKCRGPEYLRIIYGPEYTLPENLSRLRSRGLGGKRALALKELALGVEALERFVRREPLRRVHECVFGVLALESEPIDPRL
ncbi:MAG: hypothetical protein U0166_16980 [Acidobacteriota bacterium]